MPDTRPEPDSDLPAEGLKTDADVDRENALDHLGRVSDPAAKAVLAHLLDVD